MVSVGVITGAHGVKGEVKLKSFTAEPAAIAGYGPLETQAGRRIEIAKLRSRPDGFIATVKGVAGRTQAEALIGTELFVARALLPDPAGDEVYLSDLIGLAVWLKDGRRLGDVVNIADYGAGPLLDVKMADGQETVLIPFTRAFIIETDILGGKIVADLPEGFLDEDDAQQ